MVDKCIYPHYIMITRILLDNIFWHSCRHTKSHAHTPPTRAALIHQSCKKRVENWNYRLGALFVSLQMHGFLSSLCNKKNNLYSETAKILNLYWEQIKLEFFLFLSLCIQTIIILLVMKTFHKINLAFNCWYACTIIRLLVQQFCCLCNYLTACTIN